jgi:hypothetical protein
MARQETQKERYEFHKKFQSRKIKEREFLQDLSIEGRIILKRIIYIYIIVVLGKST